MPLVAQSITLYFDLAQDRLNLLFIDADEQRLTGILTRRLFKGWLELLPEWLSQHSPHADSQFSREIEQLQHQQAQQVVPVAQNQVSLDVPSTTFLIETLNMNVQAGEAVRLSFLDETGEHEAVLTLNVAELHKLLAEMLAKVADWDLRNPWDPDVSVRAAGSGLLSLH
jgi:predicted DNA-binding protein (UPF0251 family)